MIAGALEARVLQANTLELRRPDREVWRVREGRASSAVEVLGVVEEEARVEAARQPCLDITVESKGIPTLKGERFFTDRSFLRKPANRPVLGRVSPGSGSPLYAAESNGEGGPE